ncbi:MAG TPA: MCE family protein [Planctomycetes bacterium]|nr:MCE family protein [Planctomycetota bacterium]
MRDPRSARKIQYLLGLAFLLALAFGLQQILVAMGEKAGKDRFPMHVLFKSAQGIRPGSQVKYRGVVVGKVGRMHLDEGGERVRVTLHLLQEARVLMSSRTQVWIVRPRMVGWAGELSGLDTLIRESYLRIRCPGGGKLLPQGSELLGLERPPKSLAESRLEDPKTGDLLATVVLAESFGLRPGVPVRFRGLNIGEVRSVRLQEGGGAVLVEFRVSRTYRPVVKEDSKVWVARPILRGNLLTGATVDNLAAILQPALALGGGSPGSLPASDGQRFVAETEPPKALPRILPLPKGNRPEPPKELGKWLDPVVEVRYRAVEKDLFKDDPIEEEGKGILYRRGPDHFVLCPRSLVDGSYILEGNFFDSIQIAEERIRVQLGDGRILPVRRVWVSPKDDLAVLEVQGGGTRLHLKKPALYLDFSTKVKPASLDLDKQEKGKLLQKGPRYIGLIGMEKAKPGSRQWVSFSEVPEVFRPGK